MTDVRNWSDGVHASRRLQNRRLSWLIAALLMILLSVAIRVWYSESDHPSPVTVDIGGWPETSVVQSVDPGRGTQHAALTIATWNINYNNQDLDEVERLLLDSSADIICLQETTERSETLLTRKLAERYPSQFTAGHAGRFLAEGFLVLSKQQILNPRFVPSVRTYFGHVAFEIDCAGQAITVISVHLTPFTTRGARSIPQLLSVLGATEVDHQEEIRSVIKELPHDRPVIILGDFNSPAHGIAPTTLAANGLTDLFAQLHADPDETHKSWDFPLPNELHATWRIDYVFYSHHFTPLAAHLERCHSSDHHLLIGKLQCAP
ncbi:MAG TPA: endonuclease/exonuclease/phosphatase family protein [Planctomycetaceae bacterium]|nr:endonuclease/exonuclease/phosphatase family protein [Planctomycetaceae bacterium]